VAEVKINVTATNKAGQALGAVKKDLREVGDAAENASSRLGGFFKDIASQAGGNLLSGALEGIASGFMQVAQGGIATNQSLENVRAQLMAFTKDGAAADAILADIRQEAASTPFAFEEMAAATSSLMSSAKAANTPLMDLVKQAEILAASNPAEGLAGAAFALREAVSGDFTSVIERFNLPRQYINELRKQGVPDLEIVQRAMQQMGLDIDLVSNLADTFTGKMSTFQDELSNVRATVTEPMFEAMKVGLDNFMGRMEANGPAIQEWATGLGESLGRVATSAISIAEKVPWAGIASGIADVAAGAATLAGWFDQAYTAAAQLYILGEATEAAAAAFFTGEDASAAFNETVARLGQTFNLVAADTAPATAAAMEEVASEAQRGSVVAYTAEVQRMAEEADAAATKIRERLGASIKDTKKEMDFGDRARILEQAADAQENYVDRVEQANAKAAEDEAKYRQEVREGIAELQKARTEYVNDTLDKQRELGGALTELERGHAQALAQIDEARGEAAEARRAGELKAEQEFVANREKVQREAAERIGKAEQDLARKRGDYARQEEQREAELGKRKQSLLDGFNEKVGELGEKRVEIEQTTRDRLADIERDLAAERTKIEEDFQKRNRKTREGIAEIEGSISGNAMALVKNGRAKLESFLSEADRKRLAELRSQAAEEQAERDKALADAESKAEQDVATAEQAAQDKLSALDKQLAEEKARLDKATQEATDRHNLETENRRFAFERETLDMQAAIEAQRVARDTQLAELAAKREAELADIATKNVAATQELDKRYAAESIKHEEQRAALVLKNQQELEDLRLSYNERVATVQARQAEIKAEFLATQADHEQRLYEMSAAHHQRMGELVQQWQGPISEASRYRDIVSSIDPALRGAFGINTPTSASPAPGGGLSKQGPGFARGGSFIVPPGFPGDTFPMRVSSGERVTVTPANQTTNNSRQTIVNINVPNVSSAQELATMTQFNARFWGG
jgi:hypothetical protein